MSSIRPQLFENWMTLSNVAGNWQMSQNQTEILRTCFPRAVYQIEQIFSLTAT